MLVLQDKFKELGSIFVAKQKMLVGFAWFKGFEPVAEGLEGGSVTCCKENSNKLVKEFKHPRNRACRGDAIEKLLQNVRATKSFKTYLYGKKLIHCIRSIVNFQEHRDGIGCETTNLSMESGFM